MDIVKNVQCRSVAGRLDRICYQANEFGCEDNVELTLPQRVRDRNKSRCREREKSVMDGKKRRK